MLAVGAAVMLGVNAWLLRSTLRPLNGLTALMERVDLLRPGQRLSVSGDRDVAILIQTFNEMLDRLEQERGASTAHTPRGPGGRTATDRPRTARRDRSEPHGRPAGPEAHHRSRADELADELRTIQEMVRGSLDEVGMVARRLRPGVLSDLGSAQRDERAGRRLHRGQRPEGRPPIWIRSSPSSAWRPSWWSTGSPRRA